MATQGTCLAGCWMHRQPLASWGNLSPCAAPTGARARASRLPPSMTCFARAVPAEGDARARGCEKVSLPGPDEIMSQRHSREEFNSLSKEWVSNNLALDCLVNRRALLGALTWLCAPEPAFAAPGFLEQGFNKYVKKRKLDPLETYVPTVLLAVAQIDEVGSIITNPASDKEAILNARYLLRTGAASSLRTDLRAIAQYAEETGEESAFPFESISPKDDAERCLESLVTLDSLMRTEPDRRDIMVESLEDVRRRLDRLLATVPAEVLKRSKAVVGGSLVLDQESSPSDLSAERVENNNQSQEPGLQAEGAPAAGSRGDLPLKIEQLRKDDVKLLERIL